MKKYAFCFALGIICSFSACKEEEYKPKPGTPPVVVESTPNTRLLTNKYWKLTSFTRSDVSDDLVKTIPSCQQDNFYIFTETRSLLVDEGKINCTPSSNDQGAWSFYSNETIIGILIPNLKAYGLSGNFEVDTLTTSELSLKRTEGTITYEALFKL